MTISMLGNQSHAPISTYNTGSDDTAVVNVLCEVLKDTVSQTCVLLLVYCMVVHHMNV